MTKAETLYSFWASFGLPAYSETAVPDEAKLPYITYQIQTDSFGRQILMSASVWYRTESLKEINAKTEEISRRIGESGILIDGKTAIRKAHPFSQISADQEDKTVKRSLLNVFVEFFTNN